MKRTILLVMLGVALFSCQTKKAVISTNYIAGSTYSGTLPCEDCNGIRQVVVLDSGNSFKLSETYLGKEGCKEKCGRWFLEDGKVMLYTDNAPIAQYAVSGGNLVSLDRSNFSQAARQGQGMLSRKHLVRSKKINQKYLDGLDVVGFGGDPSWSLDITHNKAIQFSVPGMDAPFAVSPVVPKLSGDSLIYDIVTSSEKMKIIFSPGICGDNAGDNVYDYKVTISFRGKTYRGCGAILNADGSLDGTWLLQSWADHANNWKEQPYLTIDLAGEKFYGNTGCNDFAGSTRLRQLHVCFSDIKTGSKTCEGFDESAFIETLVKCNGFSISDGKLELTHDGRTIMTFQRQVKETDQL